LPATGRPAKLAPPYETDRTSLGEEISQRREPAPPAFEASGRWLRAGGFAGHAARRRIYALDFKKSQIGIASTWGMVTPCNMHIDGLARQAEAGVNAAGSKAVIFNTITISDGISMGTEGMKYSLVSREVIADSIETVMGCEGFDGLVAIGGCDKNMPGCLIAIARLNRPAVFVYGGTILPGCIGGVLANKRLRKERAALLADRKLDIVSCFEAVGQFANGALDDRELALIEEQAIPGAGSCGGMYTANTMASAVEALGMSLAEFVSAERHLEGKANGRTAPLGTLSTKCSSAAFVRATS
jgi:dihydroxyacid dehydratase/phosphogluconate dehydratase